MRSAGSTALLVLLALPRTDGRTWSALTMAPCSATDKYQRFTVQSSAGRGTITDRETGRCVAARSCDFGLKGGDGGDWQYGAVVLDDCEAVSSCKEWAATGLAPGKAFFEAEKKDPPLSFVLNAVGTPDGFDGPAKNPSTPEDWALVDKLLPSAEWVRRTAGHVFPGHSFPHAVANKASCCRWWPTASRLSPGSRGPTLSGSTLRPQARCG